MIKNPLTSIVVITYNSSKFVIETLESCLAQTYQNIELIICDDASTDNTVELCSVWLSKNKSRFVSSSRIIKSKVNTGIAPNFNRGVYAANGLWIKPIAGDDLLTPNCIEYIIGRINEINDEAYAYSTPHIKFSIQNNNKVLQETKIKKRPHFFLPHFSAYDQYQMALRTIEQPSVQGLMIRKDVFNSIGGCDERFPMLEDRPLILNILKNGYRIEGDDHPTVLYRIHNQSTFNKKRDQKIVPDFIVKYKIPVRREYFLPYLSTHVALAFNWVFFVTKVFSWEPLNKKNKLNITLKRFLIKPFSIFIYLVHRNWFRKLKAEKGI